MIPQKESGCGDYIRRTRFICAVCNESKPCAKANWHTGKVCRNCKLSIMAKERAANQSGADNPNWKGGGRYWSEGRVTYDSNGCHYKEQRALAYERDGNKCVACGTDDIKLECHHKVPYEISGSHALHNLTILCITHHLKVERFINDVGAYPYVWPLLDFDVTANWTWPPAIDTEEPPF